MVRNTDGGCFGYFYQHVVEVEMVGYKDEEAHDNEGNDINF